MSKFSDYLASQITPQMTLLEKFNLMIKFLKENNYISIFYSQENYNVQTESYLKSKVNLNGFELHIGDCIVFSNGYYAFVETIGIDNFTIGNVLYFQGEQGVSVIGATISSGCLILTLSDGENVNAGFIGAVSSFSINESQHLIVNYANGTTQDLGAIFNGNVNISGNLNVTGLISQALDNIYNLSLVPGNANLTLTDIYSKIIIKNSILYVVVNFKLENQTGSEIVSQAIASANVSLPSEVANNIYDLAGNNGSVTLTTPCGVCSVVGIDSDNIQLSGVTTQKVTLTLVKQNAPRTYGVLMRNNEGYRIPANSVRYLTARMMLTL